MGRLSRPSIPVPAPEPAVGTTNLLLIEGQGACPAPPFLQHMICASQTLALRGGAFSFAPSLLWPGNPKEKDCQILFQIPNLSFYKGTINKR